VFFRTDPMNTRISAALLTVSATIALPLLAALPAKQAPGALAAMRAAGFTEAAVIGRVLGAPAPSTRQAT